MGSRAFFPMAAATGGDQEPLSLVSGSFSARLVSRPDGVHHGSDLAGSEIRPENCILENRRLNVQSVSVMKNWKEDLDSFLDKYGDDLIKEAKGQKN